jgi:hypothetical protein
MRSTMKGAAFAVAGLASLLACSVAFTLIPGTSLLWVAGGFVGYVACGRRAVILWRLDDHVFDHPHRHVPSRQESRRIVGLLPLASTPFLGRTLPPG